jgi:hypothetical protein
MEVPTGVGIDLGSVLKTVRDDCEGALRALASYQENHDPQNFAEVAKYLREMDQFIGGPKLQWMIMTMDGAANRPVGKRGK